MTCNCNSSACKCRQGLLPETTDKTNYFVQTDMASAEFFVYPVHERFLVEAQVKEDGVDLIYVHRSLNGYSSASISVSTDGRQTFSSTNSDFTTKEIYRIQEGKLVLVKTLTGTIVPPKLEESYEFPE